MAIIFPEFLSCLVFFRNIEKFYYCDIQKHNIYYIFSFIEYLYNLRKYNENTEKFTESSGTEAYFFSKI